MKPSFREWKIELSDTAARTAKSLEGKDRSLVVEALRIIKRDPFDRKHTVKLIGPYAGHRRIRKGDWRIIYRVEEDTIQVVYIRRRGGDTHR